MRKTIISATAFALFVGAGLPLTAHANLLTNGGLEVTAQQLQADPTLLYPDNLIHASYAIHSNALTGWTLGGACIDVVPNSYWTGTEGNYSVDLIGTSGIGSISQTVTGLTPGTAYQLTFGFAINPEKYDNEQNSTKILQVTATNSDLAPTTFSGTAGSATNLNMGWINETLTFTANASSVTLTLAALMPTGLPNTFTPSTVFCGPVIDNLDLEPLGGNPQTPEPASAGILSLGVLNLLRRRARRSR